MLSAACPRCFPAASMAMRLTTPRGPWKTERLKGIGFSWEPQWQQNRCRILQTHVCVYVCVYIYIYNILYNYSLMISNVWRYMHSLALNDSCKNSIQTSTKRNHRLAYHVQRHPKCSNLATGCVEPPTPKSQCFNARVSKSDFGVLFRPLELQHLSSHYHWTLGVRLY